MRQQEGKAGSEAQGRDECFRSLLKDSQLIKGDLSCSTAIVALWTRKETVAQAVEKSRYCVIGQLYSPERGIDLLIRNLLANPNITNLVVTGNDLTGSGSALIDFFAEGVVEGETRQGVPCWKVRSKVFACIGKDISREDIDMLRSSVHVERIDVPERIAEFREKKMGSRRRMIYEVIETQTEEYPGEDTVYVVREEHVVDAWLKILDLVMKFGKVTPTRFDSKQKEIIDVVSIITGEDPNSPVIPDFFPFTKEHFSEYSSRFLSGDMVDGVAYTYGNRMRSFFGSDQLALAARKLTENPNSRDAVVSLWDSMNDLGEKESPCLNHIWIRVRQGKLFMSATLRSNDMFAGYPENALALRLLQEQVRRNLQAAGNEIALGDLVVISHSAHVYEENWDAALEAASRRQKQAVSHDQRGSFYISVDEKQRMINVDYLTPSGEKVRSYQGESAKAVRDILSCENVVGTPGHGIYLGIELCKAERALRKGVPYEQDS